MRDLLSFIRDIRTRDLEPDQRERLGLSRDHLVHFAQQPRPDGHNDNLPWTISADAVQTLEELAVVGFDRGDDNRCVGSLESGVLQDWTGAVQEMEGDDVHDEAEIAEDEEEEEGEVRIMNEMEEILTDL